MQVAELFNHIRNVGGDDVWCIGDLSNLTVVGKAGTHFSAADLHGLSDFRDPVPILPCVSYVPYHPGLINDVVFLNSRRSRHPQLNGHVITYIVFELLERWLAIRLVPGPCIAKELVVHMAMSFVS